MPACQANPTPVTLGPCRGEAGLARVIKAAMKKNRKRRITAPATAPPGAFQLRRHLPILLGLWGAALLAYSNSFQAGLTFDLWPIRLSCDYSYNQIPRIPRLGRHRRAPLAGGVHGRRHRVTVPIHPAVHVCRRNQGRQLRLQRAVSIGAQPHLRGGAPMSPRPIAIPAGWTRQWPRREPPLTVSAAPPTCFHNTCV